jgi:hypothetical protein
MNAVLYDLAHCTLINDGEINGISKSDGWSASSLRAVTTCAVL